MPKGKKPTSTEKNGDKETPPKKAAAKRGKPPRQSASAKKMAANRTPTRKKVETLTHDKQTRLNNPTAEMEPLMRDADIRPAKVSYARNPDLDPQLLWTGKDEENKKRLEVDAAPIYIQEKIHPQAIIADLHRRTAQRRQEQSGQAANLFDDFNGLPDDATPVATYQHAQKWTNRMILGDSLLVMTSLMRKENLRGMVQCIYMDPPYGIKFGSNFQLNADNLNVRDDEESHEPEMIQAFRDTWKNNIHSYLSYLRDRLTAARDLLTESGSMFLQMGDDNVHRAAALMDEVFGADNRMATITFATTTGSSAKHLPQVADYILWYAKNKEDVRYTQLYEQLSRKEIVASFSWASQLEEKSGVTRSLTEQEMNNPQRHAADARIFKRTGMDSQGWIQERSKPYMWRNIEYSCANNRHWSVSKEGMDRMDKAGRLHANEGQTSLCWKRYEEEVPGKRISNVWPTSMRPMNRHYVVQTDTRIIERCMLMTTKPGDLVLDPTCGSGTTAVTAEQWGRRWITVDTSRVALAIARARLMSTQYEYYLMQDSAEGAQKEAELSGQTSPEKEYANDVRLGFVYDRVNKPSPKLIAYNEEIDVIWEKWQETMSLLQQAFNDAVGKHHEEWEIPLVKPEDASWDAATTQAHKDWCNARTDRQKEIDASINANTETVMLVNRPRVARNIVRVTGPFTVESLSPYRLASADSTDEDASAHQSSEGNFVQVIHEKLIEAGIKGAKKESRIEFDSIKPWANGRHIQFAGHYNENGKQKKAAICVGPEYGTVTRTLMNKAAIEAADMFDMLIVMGFAFQAYADDKLAHYGMLPVLRVRLHQELHMGRHLEEGANSNSFVMLGEPDIALHHVGDGELQVEVRGMDIYNPVTDEVRPSNVKDIACWMIDTEYDSMSFFARHVYFPGGGKDHYKRLERTLQAEIDKEAWETLRKTTSRPFPRPSTGSIAVKVINHHGDEVIKVFEVE